jgi:hypothetical protein
VPLSTFHLDKPRAFRKFCAPNVAGVANAARWRYGDDLQRHEAPAGAEIFSAARPCHASPQNYLTPQEALKREKIDRHRLYIWLYESEEHPLPARAHVFIAAVDWSKHKEHYIFIFSFSLWSLFIFIYLFCHARTHTQNIMEAGRSAGDIKNTFCRLSARRLTYFTYFPMPASIPTLTARCMRSGRGGWAVTPFQSAYPRADNWVSSFLPYLVCSPAQKSILALSCRGSKSYFQHHCLHPFYLYNL